MTLVNLGLVSLDHVQFAVQDLSPSQQLYEERFGFQPLWRSDPGYTERTGHKSVVYGAGNVCIMVTAAVGDKSDAARFLRIHPEGVMTVAFAVQDVSHAFATLEKRCGTPLAEPTDSNGHQEFDLATPLGEVVFRFIERKGPAFAPGFVRQPSSPRPGTIPWIEIDHLTSNVHTMRPLTDWYRDVMGMEHYWDVTFHTTMTPEGKQKDHGTGLKSLVMWDKHSGIKFATNELLIVCDDINLPFGRLRLRGHGSDGGHNGLSSVIATVGSEQVARLRIGVGNDFTNGAQADYVLSTFAAEEREELKNIIERAGDTVLFFAEHGMAATMSKYNS
jgi:catechol 2,3-dioxygenase-like lactoylglutathione lyase family enzyme